MKYKELPKNVKQRINGSINNSLKACTALYSSSFEKIFNEWFDRKIYFIKGKWYYNFLGYKNDINKINTESTYMIDGELVKELKDIIRKRYINKCKNIQQNQYEYLQKSKNNVATKEQLESVRELHLKAYGVYKSYDERLYTMFEVDKIKKQLELKIKYDNWTNVYK